MKRACGPAERGKLRIGDDWNAITIIALSQSNPLKAVAEFVENSAGRNLKIVRFRPIADVQAKRKTVVRPGFFYKRRGLARVSELGDLVVCLKE